MDKGEIQMKKIKKLALGTSLFWLPIVGGYLVKLLDIILKIIF